MRCNAGVPPYILTDQHLIAEYRELMIPVGQLKSLGWQTKTPIPEKLALGKGHVSFWRDKQIYLKRRHEGLVEEMKKRGFQVNYSFFDLSTIPERWVGDWQPSAEDSYLLRSRIWERFLDKPEWYRWHGKPLLDVMSVKGYEKALFNAPVAL